jgi:hypothetical protein
MTSSIFKVRFVGLGFFLTSFLTLFLFSQAVGALTMINQNESEVIESTFRDYDKDGKADGDLVLMMLFHQTSEKRRDVYTFQLQEFLTDEDSNLKEHLAPGDLLPVANSRLNPFSNLLSNQSGSLVIAFIQKIDNQYIIKSMKPAPVDVYKDADGQDTLVITNPWAQTPPSATALQMDHPQLGKVYREHYDSFTDRLKQKISARPRSTK